MSERDLPGNCSEEARFLITQNLEQIEVEVRKQLVSVEVTSSVKRIPTFSFRQSETGGNCFSVFL